MGVRAGCAGAGEYPRGVFILYFYMAPAPTPLRPAFPAPSRPPTPLPTLSHTPHPRLKPSKRPFLSSLRPFVSSDDKIYQETLREPLKAIFERLGVAGGGWARGEGDLRGGLRGRDPWPKYGGRSGRDEGGENPKSYLLSSENLKNPTY